MKRDIIIALVMVVALAIAFGLSGGGAVWLDDAQPHTGTEVTGKSETVIATTTTEPPPASTPTTTEPTQVLHYPLTDEERDLVERVVMAESGGESYEGQMAVAQCILNASRLKEVRPPDIVKGLKYAKARPTPSEGVKQAVSAVFDDGVTVFDEEVIYFYAPARVVSNWHESQVYVVTIGCHRFFKEAQ